MSCNVSGHKANTRAVAGRVERHSTQFQYCDATFCGECRAGRDPKAWASGLTAELLNHMHGSPVGVHARDPVSLRPGMARVRGALADGPVLPSTGATLPPKFCWQHRNRQERWVIDSAARVTCRPASHWSRCRIFVKSRCSSPAEASRGACRCVRRNALGRTAATQRLKMPPRRSRTTLRLRLCRLRPGAGRALGSSWSAAKPRAVPPARPPGGVARHRGPRRPAATASSGQTALTAATSWARPSLASAKSMPVLGLR